LKPKEIGTNGTITNAMRKYDKCGADFSEREYKNVEVINQVEQKTVEKKRNRDFIFYYFLFRLIRFEFYALYISA